jgi:hypothetical protein
MLARISCWPSSYRNGGLACVRSARGGRGLIPPSPLTPSGAAGAGASVGVGIHRPALRAAETSVSFSWAGKAVPRGTYLRPSIFAPLLGTHRLSTFLGKVAQP